jgi:hypothetical protein
MVNLKKAFSLAVVLAWAGLAISADPPGSAKGSSTLPPTTTSPAAPATSGGCCSGGCQSGGCCNSGGCCDNSCGVDLGCDQGCQNGDVIIGGSWYILRPVVNDNRAFTLTTPSAGITTVNTVQNNFNYPFETDPFSLWAGYRSACGLGFTVSWFHLDDGAPGQSLSLGGAGLRTVTAPAPTIPGTTLAGGVLTIAEIFGLATPLTFNSDIRMDIWDFDVTQKLDCKHFELIFGGGIRYMHIGQDYTATASIPAIPRVAGTPGSITDFLGNSYDGGGPTIVLNGVRNFGCSGFGLYANSRAGVLFGAKRETGSVTATSVVSSLVFGLGGLTDATATSDNESTIAFGEIEMGLQWARRMGRYLPFVRVGFEGREYWGIGNAVNATSGNNSSAVGLFGLSLASGVGW